MATIDRKPKPVLQAGSGKPFAEIDADRFDKAGTDKGRKQLMAAADRYHSRSKQRPPA